MLKSEWNIFSIFFDKFDFTFVLTFVLMLFFFRGESFENPWTKAKEALEKLNLTVPKSSSSKTTPQFYYGNNSVSQAQYYNQYYNYCNMYSYCNMYPNNYYQYPYNQQSPNFTFPPPPPPPPQDFKNTNPSNQVKLDPKPLPIEKSSDTQNDVTFRPVHFQTPSVHMPQHSSSNVPTSLMDSASLGSEVPSTSSYLNSQISQNKIIKFSFKSQQKFPKKSLFHDDEEMSVDQKAEFSQTSFSQNNEDSCMSLYNDTARQSLANSSSTEGSQREGNDKFQSNSPSKDGKIKEWPPSLKNYVQKCFASVDEKDRDRMEAKLKQVLLDAMKNNTAYSHPWDDEPLLTLSPKQRDVMPNKLSCSNFLQASNRLGTLQTPRKARKSRWESPGFQRIPSSSSNSSVSSSSSPSPPKKRLKK